MKLNARHGFYSLLITMIFAITGCGSSIVNTAAIDSNSRIAAKLSYPKTANKSAAKLTPDIVSTVVVTVIGTAMNGQAIPVVRTTTTIGSDNEDGVTVNGVYAGTVSVNVTAFDACNAAVYEGFVMNVRIPEGGTGDAGTIVMSVPLVKSAEGSCWSCHETTLDATGQGVLAGYKQSVHYTNIAFADGKSNAAGCVGCHGPSHNIPDPSAFGSSILGTYSSNSVRSIRCFDCHKVNNDTLVANHNAVYAASQIKCSACHDFHNPLIKTSSYLMFTEMIVSGKSFAYKYSDGDQGTMTFKADHTMTMTPSSGESMSGTWSIHASGQLMTAMDMGTPDCKMDTMTLTGMTDASLTCTHPATSSSAGAGCETVTLTAAPVP